SVHVELFTPVNATYKDPELASRWEDIISVRKEVTKALELARKEKKIGHSLDASVSLGLSPELMEKLTPYREQLKSIFIVSSVDTKDFDRLEEGLENDTLPGLKVHITPSSNPKCERCWVHDSTVGHDSNHPTICERCLHTLAEME
ncbi:MAG: isoleucine--tRNA ligase, partial [Desulfobacteraceae bacterium]